MLATIEAKSVTSDARRSTNVTPFWWKKARFWTEKTMFIADSRAE